MEQLCLNIKALQSMHRFGDILEEAITGIQSDIAEFSAIRDAKDCIGRHWYGMRCGVKSKYTDLRLYLHIGLIYYPSTRPGLMVELDEQNNKSIYQRVLDNIVKISEFEINRDEAEYFKLFMPDATFVEISGKERQKQVISLRQYVKEAGEAILQAAYEEGFTLEYSNLSDSLNLVKAFDLTLNSVEGEYSKVEVNYADKDNFGQYAEGFRYYLSDREDTLKLYAYFGAIYSYKKQPAGIFAEVDWYSNQEVYDVVFCNMEQSDVYDFSSKEPKFIKLFMKESVVEEFNKAEYETQIEMLKDFLKECNDQMIKAGKRGGATNV